MKNAIAAAINWAAFAVVAPVLFGVGGFLLYTLCTEGAPNAWAYPSWPRFAFAAAELLLGAWAMVWALAWWDKLPKAAWTKRPISSFFRHG